MRRTRSGIFDIGKWLPSRGTPLASICCFIIFAIFCSNLIALYVFGITIILDFQRNPECLSEERHRSPSTSPAMNEMITNATRLDSEASIMLDDLLNILQLFKGNGILLRNSYVNAVLMYNNVSADLQKLSENYRVVFGTQSTSQRYKSDNRSMRQNTHLPLPISDKQLSESPLSSPFQIKKSFANTSRRFDSLFNTSSSVLPKLKRIDNLLSSQGRESEIDRTIALSNPVYASQDNETGARNVQQRSQLVALSKLPPCVNYTKGLTGRFKPTLQEKTPQELTSMFPQLQKGGRFSPVECTPKESTAIIIPYRNRYSHLHILLLNIVPLLIKQNVKFTIFVIEQQLPGIFNRGMLFNVGFMESLKLDNFDCFIFHDVDIIPINDRNFYHCNHQPTHFLTGVNKFGYKLMYQDMFGGVVAFTRKQFTNINGASNLYFGWGGEDDDLQKRVKQRGYTVMRKYSTIGLYDMIQHSRDKTNNVNPLRKQLLKFAVERQDTEGLNTAEYTRHSVQQLPLYTWVKVSINMPSVLLKAPKKMQQILDQMLKYYVSTDTNSSKV